MAAKRSKKRSTTKRTAARGAKRPAKKAKAAKLKVAKVKAAKAGAKGRKAVRPAKKAAAKRPAPARKAAGPAKAVAAPAQTSSRFVWFDLVTKDLGAAQAFYTPLMGWGTKDAQMPPPAHKYTMFNWKGEDFGGMVPLPGPEVPNHWMPYVSVDDVDRISRRAEQLGGKVLMPGMDIPQVGRFSVIADPTGGMVSPMSFNQPLKPPPERGVLGPVAWVELQSTDPQKAASFYKELFGWGSSEMEMGPGAKYTVLKAGDHDVGGIGEKAPSLPGTMWLTYFSVDDVDGKAQAAVVAGATVIGPAFDVPTIGRMAYMKDPQGAIFALFRGAPAAPSA